jgi:hypothetical protein
MTVPNDAILVASARFKDASDNDCVNVYNFKCDFTAAQTEEDVFDAIDTYLTTVYGAFDNFLDGTANAYDLKVDVIEFTDGEWKVVQNVGFGPWGSGIILAALDETAPGGVAALGKLYTGLGRHTGKKFFGLLDDEVFTNTGELTSTVVSAVETGLTYLLTPHVISAGNELIAVVVDRAFDVVREVIEVGCSSIIAYQRRRRAGTGS